MLEIPCVARIEYATLFPAFRFVEFYVFPEETSRNFLLPIVAAINALMTAYFYATLRTFSGLKREYRWIYD